ncbi:MAG TPA: hypothetical protein PKM01_07785, partial [Anaerolineaceae bacterium]|nr:hypothetical protein [Anaerolineaceae bacterium]
ERRPEAQAPGGQNKSQGEKMYDLNLNSVCFVGPFPDWAGQVAIALVVALVALVITLTVVMATTAARIAGSFRKTGKLPESLMKFAEARQPLREHKHIHYSVAATEQMEREQQAAATGPIPLDEAGYDFYGIDSGMN